jgi:hypothetical protein
VDVNPAALNIDGGNIECEQLAEPQTRVDGESERGPVLCLHRGDQRRRFGWSGNPVACVLAGREPKPIARIEVHPAAHFSRRDQRPQRSDDIPDRGRRPFLGRKPVRPPLKLRAL